MAQGTLPPIQRSQRYDDSLPAKIDAPLFPTNPLQTMIVLAPRRCKLSPE
jgi:hypothetical protein